MRALTTGVLCGVLLISGCTRQEINSVSSIQYQESDEAGEIVLKTAGNIPPWVMGAPIYALGWILEFINFKGFDCPCAGMLSGISFRR